LFNREYFITTTIQNLPENFILRDEIPSSLPVGRQVFTTGHYLRLFLLAALFDFLLTFFFDGFLAVLFTFFENFLLTIIASLK